jgi:methylthioribulose-1-phosphate dehydratase
VVTAEHAIDSLIEAARWMSARGLLPATSGNLSARLSETHAVITASGVDKGSLRPQDFIVLELHEPPRPGTSAETPLHLRLYRDDADVGAVLHGHSMVSTLMSQRGEREGGLRLHGYELQKAFAGVGTHDVTVEVPVVPNGQDVEALAGIVATRLASRASGVVHAPCYLLAGHGFYGWGRTVADARRHVEALDFLLGCELEKARMRP